MNWLQKVSMPVFPDYLDDLHDPDLRKHVPPSTKFLVYHGTSSKRLALVMQTGYFDPHVADKSYESASAGVYVTTSLGLMGAELFAHHAANGTDEIPGDGGDPVVVELVVPLEWIEQDPDDTRLDEEGKMNQMGRMQGRIMRRVSIKHIRQVMISNEVLADAEPHPLRGKLMYSNHTQWTPIGKMLDIIKSQVDWLPEEYGQMIEARPRGMSRSEAYEERESELAGKLVGILHTFGSMGEYPGGSSDFDATLSWIYENGISISSSAESTLSTYFEHMSPGSWEYISNEVMGGDYVVQPGERLYHYLSRNRM